MISVAIVDDDAIVRTAVEGYFAGRTDLRVVASVPAPEDLRPGANTPADVILLDLYFAGRARLDAVERLSADAHVLMMSVSGDDEDVLAAMRRGAAGYVTKAESPAVFLGALTEVAAGRTYLSPALYGIVYRAERRASERNRPHLSPRELQTVRLLARGLTYRLISREMNVRESTVAENLKRVRRKLGLATRGELIGWAYEEGHLGVEGPSR